MSDHLAANLANWNERALIHAQDRSGSYRIDDFKQGAVTLYPLERLEIGDVSGLAIAHLQCHIGLDTLSLARLGATVTGLDFSPDALTVARSLAAHTSMEARFVEGNVYDAPALLGGAQFDMVYVTWGAIYWLDDIARWARAVSAVLKPGGSLYLLETHPSALVLEQIDGTLKPHYPWRTPKDAPLAFDETQTYTGDETPLVNTRSYSWNHSLSDIVGALRDTGMEIDFLREHEVLPYKLFPMMQAAEHGFFRLPSEHALFPLSFSLRAIRSGGATKPR